MSIPYKCLVTIPIYNHGSTIQKVALDIIEQGYPLLIVDDGCDQQTALELINFSQQHEEITLLRHPKNLGKGAAFFTAIDYAKLHNFTHTFLVDADGQHDLKDLKKFESLLNQNPNHAVFGNPVFNESAPKARVIGHHITNFFINISTGKDIVLDALCGFRLYPVHACHQLMITTKIGSRMEFDPEISVKLSWQGVKIINQDTQIIYKDGGVSNFRVIYDNARISWMHTKLITISIFKRLLGHPLSSQSENWIEQKEKGSALSLTLMRLLLKVGGRHVARYILYLVITYYYLFSKKSREASKHFLEKINHQKQSPKEKIPWKDSWKHHLEFGIACLDRAICWSGKTDHFKINFHNYEEVYKRALGGQGSILLGAHIGNIDILRAYNKHEKRVKINVLMVKNHSKSFQSFIKKLNEDSDIEIIPIEDIQLSTSTLIQSKLDNGELIALLGDRTTSDNQESFEELPFLGTPAPFPNGPYLLSYLFNCPIYTIFSVRKSDSNYEVYIEKLSETLKGTRLERKENIQKAMQEYVLRLENIAMQYPLQWFNFYNFWAKKA